MRYLLRLPAAPSPPRAGVRTARPPRSLLRKRQRRGKPSEIKRRERIGEEVSDEVQAKVSALGVPRGTTIRTALVYEGELSPRVEADGYFDFLIPAERLLEP